MGMGEFVEPPVDVATLLPKLCGWDELVGRYQPEKLSAALECLSERSLHPSRPPSNRTEHMFKDPQVHQIINAISALVEAAQRDDSQQKP